ncbi:putative Ig domain-containing protein [Candidatus Latescibacterota bacterium]
MRRYITSAVFLLLLLSLSTAAFPFTLTVNWISDNGTVTMIPTEIPLMPGTPVSLPDNTEVTLSAVFNDGFMFDGWFEGTNSKGITPSITFNLNSNMVIEARFKPDDGGGTGETVSTPFYMSGPSQVNMNENVIYTFSSSSSEGHDIEYQYIWGDGPVGEWGLATQSHTWAGPGVYEIFAMARCINHPEIATTTSIGFMVTVMDSTDGGDPGGEYQLVISVEPAGSGIVRYFPERVPAMYTFQEVVNLEAVANPTYMFSYWGGDAVGGKDTQITMDSDKNVVAYFAVDSGDPGGEPGDDKLPPATANMPYYFKLVTESADDTYELLDGPDWLSLEYTGVFGGNPAAADVGNGFSVSVNVFEAVGGTHVAYFFIDVLPDDGSVPTDEKLPPATVGIDYYFMITGQSAGSTLTLDNGPSWLTLTTTGELGGMPAAADVGNGFPIHVIASDVTGAQYDLNFFIDVFSSDDPGDPGGEPMDNILPPATVNRPYYFKVLSRNSDDTYELVGGPGWITIQPTGELGGTPFSNDVGNNFSVSVKVMEPGGITYDMIMLINVLPSDEPGDPGGEPGEDKLPPAIANMEYYFKLITGNPEDTFEKVSSPGWLTVARTGELGGMPAAADIGDLFSITVRIIESSGNSYNKEFFLDVMPSDDPSDPGGEPGGGDLPPAFVNMQYYFKLVSGNPDDTFEMVSGPGWLTLQRTGELGGMPAAADVGNGISVMVNIVESTGTRHEVVFMLDVMTEDDPGGEPGEEMLPSAIVNMDYYFMIPFQNPSDTFDLIEGPGWLNLNTDSGIFSGMPAAADEGLGINVVVEIKNTDGNVKEIKFVIDVHPGGEPGGEPGEDNLPPAVVNMNYYFMLPNQNPGDTYDLVRAPGWMNLDQVSGVFGGMPAAADEGFGINVIINIKDASGIIKELRLMIDVYPEGDTGGTGMDTLPPAVANMEYYFMIPAGNTGSVFEITDGPEWLRINTENGQLGGMPSAADVGNGFAVKILITDSSSGSFELILSIDVLLDGDPGVPGEKYFPPAFANMEYYFMLPNRNPGDTFEIKDGPEWLRIDSAIGQLGGMPTEDDIDNGIEVTILVTSLTGDSYQDLYMMDVLREGDPGLEPGEKFLPPATANMEYIFIIPFGGPDDTYELVDGPGWMRLNTDSTELRGKPAAADVMNGISVTIKITDSAGGSRDEMFMLDVYPEGAGDDRGMEIPAAVVNVPYYFMFPGRSPEDTFELVEGPDWMMMDRNTGQMTGMPIEADIAEDIPIVITITGPDGDSFDAKLMLQVYPEGSHGGEGLPPATANMEYKFLLPDDNPDAKYDLVNGPAWLLLDQDIGEFSGMPADADIGEGFRVEFTITLRTGEIYEKSTKIDVYSEGGPGGDMFLPPAIAGIEYDFMLPRENINDIFEIVDGPEWLTIDSRTGQFGGMPVDTDVGFTRTVGIRVNGESANPYDLKFMIEVFPFGQDDKNHLPPAIANMEYYFMVPRIEVEGTIELISGPGWLTFDSATRVFSGMPAAADIGMDFSVVIKITPTAGASFEETLILEVFDENGPQNEMFLPAAIANIPYYFKITDIEPGELLEIFEGPEWLEFDQTNRQLSGLPTDADIGYGIAVIFQITDANSLVFKENLMIDVLQEGGSKGLYLPPATVNMPYEYFLPKRNIDDTIELIEGPGWLRFDSVNALLKGMPSKDDAGFGIPVTITITDATGDSYNETLMLEVFHTGGQGGDFLPPATVNIQYYYLPPEANPGDNHEIIEGPGWLMMDSRTAQMTGMPAAADAGYGIPVVIQITPVEGEINEIKIMIDVFPEGGDNGGRVLPPAIANIPYDHVFPKLNADDSIEVVDSPDWLRINTTSGQMHGIPTDDDVDYGIPVKIMITDSTGDSTEETFMLDVFPAGDFGGKYLPPATVNLRYNFMVPMSNPDDIFTIGEGPEWLKTDPKTGSLTGTPAAADVGYGISVTLLITGTKEIVFKETFKLDVIPEGGAANVAGIFLPPATATMPYNFTLPKKNPDDTFEIGDGPTWLLVDAKTGVLSGTPAETDVGYGIPVTLELMMKTGETHNETLILDVFSAVGPRGEFLPPAVVGVEYEFKIPKTQPDDVFEIVEGPAWLSIYSKSGQLTGVADSTDAGFGISLKLSVFNRSGDTYEDEYLINVLGVGMENVVNFAPNFNATTLKDAYENSPYLEIIYVSDDNLGDKLSYSKISGPAWLSVNADNGQLSGMPQNTDVGNKISLSIAVNDAGGYADTLSTTLNVFNVENAPVFKKQKLWDATNGIAYIDTVEVSDPDGETQFTFEILTGPEWLSINNKGILSGMPGNDDVVLKKALSIIATDSTGLSTTLETTINVLSETRIESVVIDQPEKVVKIDGTMQFSAKVLTNFGTVEESAPVHWDVIGDVGTIDDNGLFTAVEGGVGFIEASTTVLDQLITSQVSVTVFLEKYKLGNIKTGAPISIDDVTYPLDFMKGAKLVFPPKSLPEDIGIEVKLPTFAHVNNDNKQITFDNNILSAVTFDVLVDDEDAGTYYFNEPIQITIPYNSNLLRNLGLSPSDLRIFYVTDTGKLVGDEIFDVVVDSLNSTISAYVSHFSSFAFVSKLDGPALIGDYDYDMDIDFLDFVQMIAYWNAGNIAGDLVGKASGTNKAGTAPWWNNSYLYPEDGVMDFEDLTVFALMHNWYQSQGSEYLTKPQTAAKKAKSNKTTGLKWDEKHYAVGDTLTVTLNAGNIDDFVAAEIVLNYDDSLLKVRSVSSSFAESEPSVISPVQFKTSNGSLTASTITLGDLREGFAISGQNIFEIDFEVIGNGELNIELAEIDMRNFRNNSPIFKIENTFINGTVGENNVPLVFELSQNYPNPFNMTTTIHYSIDIAGRTNISVYNTLGQRVKTLMNENLNSGIYKLLWNGTDEAGLEVSSGVYIITLRNNTRFDTKHILMLK